MVGRMKIRCDAPLVSFPISVFKDYILKDPVNVMDKEIKNVAVGTVDKENTVPYSMPDNSNLLKDPFTKLRDVKQTEDEAVKTMAYNSSITNGTSVACENELDALPPRSTATTVLFLDSSEKTFDSHVDFSSEHEAISSSETESPRNKVISSSEAESPKKKAISSSKTESSCVLLDNDDAANTDCSSAPENSQVQTFTSDAKLDIDVKCVDSDCGLKNDAQIEIHSSSSLNKNFPSCSEKSNDDKEAVTTEKVLTQKGSSDDLNFQKMFPVIEIIEPSDQPNDQGNSSQTDLAISRNNATGEYGLRNGHCDSVAKADKVSSESSSSVMVIDNAVDTNESATVATEKSKRTCIEKKICVGGNDVNPSAKRKTEDEGSSELKKVRVFAEKPGDESSSEITFLKKQLDVLTKKVEAVEILSSLQDSTSKPTDSSSNHNNLELRKVTRRGLFNIIKEQLVEKILYQNELGRTKRECEQLQSALEKNNLKSAQFHKEIEDMKKVTKKLQMEFIARKGQIPTPIKIRRSVGIQCSPTIISHGLVHAGHNNTKVIEARPFSEAPSGVSPLPATDCASLATDRFAPPQVLNQTPTPAYNNSPAAFASPFSSTVPPTRPRIISDVPATAPQGGPILGTFTPTFSQPVLPNKPTAFQAVTSPTARLVRAPLVMVAPPGVVFSNRRTGTIVQGNNVVTGSNTNSGNHIFVPVPVTSSLSQLVFLPTTNTLVVASNVPTSKVSVAVPSATVTLSNQSKGCLTIPSNSSVTTPIPSISNAILLVKNHPAPLPPTPPQQMCGSSKMLPPQPLLRLSKKENSIILSWSMQKTADHEDIGSYQIYAYQEGQTPPDTKLWKKVGSVKALELPMACTLTQFMAGHTYHFAVRAVDVKTRLGQFSDPQTIKLD